MRETRDVAAVYRAALEELLQSRHGFDPDALMLEDFVGDSLSVDDLARAHAKVLSRLAQGMPASEAHALMTQANEVLAAMLAKAPGPTSRDCFTLQPIHALVERQVEHAQKVAAQFGLVAIDIDRFAEYNTAFGRRAGDEALCTVRKCLESSCRAGDIVARCGGDEFCVVILGGGLRAGLIIAERMRQAVRGPDIGPGSLSISLGVVAYPADAANADALVSLAWEACRMAFLLGGNGVYTPLVIRDAPDTQEVQESHAD